MDSGTNPPGADASSAMAELAHDAERLVQRSRVLSQRVATYSSKIAGEEDSLAAEVKALQAAISRAKEAASKLEGEAGARAEISGALRRCVGIVAGAGPGGNLDKLVKPKTPFLTKLLLGRTNLVLIRKDHCIQLKEDFHSFRDKAALVLLLVPLVLLLGMHRAQIVQEAGSGGHTLTPPLMTSVQVFLVWLIYLYTSMALRENLLLINGSHIRPWWINHHYWSTVCCFLMLALPVDSAAVSGFVQPFLLWTIFQASSRPTPNPNAETEGLNPPPATDGDSSGAAVHAALQGRVGQDRGAGAWRRRGKPGWKAAAVRAERSTGCNSLLRSMSC